MLRKGSHAPCRRRRPFGFDVTHSASAACACAVAVRHGAAGQAPLAASRAKVPCSLDGLPCWCQAAYAPNCDYPLSEDEDEAEVISLQPTAELFDGAR